MFRCYLSKGQRVCLLAFYDPKLPYGLGLYMKTDWIVNPFRLDPPVRFGLILWLAAWFCFRKHRAVGVVYGFELMKLWL